MRKIIVHLLWFLPFQAISQEHDKIWFLGHDSNSTPSFPGMERIVLSFGDSLNIMQYNGGVIAMDNTNASVCDSSGQLLMASNGCYIVDSSEQVIPGSTGLNPGFMYYNFCEEGYGYNASQSMICLPVPGYADRYAFFHLPSVKEGNRFYRRNLLQTTVARAVDGNGWVLLQKNHPIVLDTFDAHGLHAVKHANGRDWWVLSVRERTNRFYFTLLSPDTLETHYQEIGLPLTEYCYGQMTFSPDGSQLAVFDAKNDLRLYDFDRCSGTLSNFRHIAVTDDADIEVFAGVAWSADGRYVYAAEITRVLQFDVQAPNILASKVVVAERNSSTCSSQPGLMFMELAPDGRIFCRSAGGNTKCMHIVQSPERAGVSCQFEQNAIDFGMRYYSNFPHFPNFRLGSLEGSGCDTLGLANYPLSGWRYAGVSGLEVDFTSVSWYHPEAWWWDFGDGGHSAEVHPRHTFPSAGLYQVCLTVSNAQGSDTQCKTIRVDVVSDTYTPQSGSRLTLYPNPTTGVVWWNDTGVCRVRVFNTLGQMVQEQQSTAGYTDLSHLVPGRYRIELTNIETASVQFGSIVLSKN